VEAVVAAIFSSPLTPISLCFSFVALIILAFVKGWIIPATTVDLLLKAAEQRWESEHQRAEDFKAALDNSEKARTLQAESLGKLLGYAEATKSMLEAMPLLDTDKESTAT